MINFLKALDIFYSLSDLGITKDKLTNLSEQVTGNLSNDRLSEKADIISKIFEESI